MKPLAVALAWLVGAIAVFGGLGLLLGLVPQGFWDALGAVVVVVVQVVLALLAVATVGQLFVDQLRSTAIAGSGRKGVVMGAIAVGSALAMLMLIGNVLDACDWYPDAMAAWLQVHLRSNGAPSLDTSVALVVVGFSALGVLGNLGRLKPEPDLAEYRRSLVYAIMGGAAAVAIGAVAKQTER